MAFSNIETLTESAREKSRTKFNRPLADCAVMYREDDRIMNLNIPRGHVAHYSTRLKLKIYQESRTVKGYNDEVRAHIDLLEFAQGHFLLWKNFLLSHFPDKLSSEPPLDIPQTAPKPLLSFKTMKLAQDYIKYTVHRINAAMKFRKRVDAEFHNYWLTDENISLLIMGLILQLRASRTRWPSHTSFLEAVNELDSKITVWWSRENWSAWGEQVRLHAIPSSKVLPSSNTATESDHLSGDKNRYRHISSALERYDRQNPQERKMRKSNPQESVDEGKNMSRDPGNKPSAQKANFKTVKRKPVRLELQRSGVAPSAISTDSAAPPSSLPHRPDTTDGLQFDLAGLQSRHQSQPQLQLDLDEYRSRLQSSPQLENRHSLPQSEFKFRFWTPLEISPSQRRSYGLKVGKAKKMSTD
jgi:hypothetical protein